MRATQTRPRFYVPSERRGVTLMSNTHYPHQHCPSRGSNPGPLAWEAKIIPLDQRCLYHIIKGGLDFVCALSVCTAAASMGGTGIDTPRRQVFYGLLLTRAQRVRGTLLSARIARTSAHARARAARMRAFFFLIFARAARKGDSTECARVTDKFYGLQTMGAC